ncbi:Ring finger domain protein [Lasiodiplodia theobromae]|uniref:Ring finger domain protein n=1 Tax=Lasiodiplodia theobromae TaxID=45133 RepID=UPI0015C3B7B9|nr:Ring finger domain protein [Lasiodiplodia theobromae]KAF4544885.1 Ring finger domain protein [Lasiodiplodia theobromae]
MRNDPMGEGNVPMAGKLGCMFVSLVGLALISICTLRRVQGIKITTNLPPCFYMIYSSSFVFIFTATIYRDAGIHGSEGRCAGSMLICLTFYTLSKVCIYIFLVERVYIVRGTTTPRNKDPLYLFNTIGMLLPCAAIYGFNVAKKFSYINDEGTCIVGIKKEALIPMMSFDVALNAYLTVMFLIRLRRLYYSSEDESKTLRNLGLRTVIGSILTLIVTVINISFLLALDGEPNWICFLSCNLDVLFAVCVIHWVTKLDGKMTKLSPYQRRMSIDPLTLKKRRPWFKVPYDNPHRTWPSNNNSLNDDKSSKNSSKSTEVVVTTAKQDQLFPEPPRFSPAKIIWKNADGGEQQQTRRNSIELDPITPSPPMAPPAPVADVDLEAQKCCRGDGGGGVDVVSLKGMLEDSKISP